ncbi:MAG: DUF481 domain-containing protein [Myxococcota bacterium]
MVRTRPFIAIAASFAVLALSEHAVAQVNAERLRSTFTDPGTYFQIDGSVSWLRGNVDFLEARSSLSLGHNHRVHTPLLTFTAAYAEINEDPYLSLAFGHARWTASWHPKVASEVFVQAQYNAFLFLRLRLVGGGGVRFLLYESESFEAHAASGYMVEREIFQRSEIPDGEPHPIASTNHRWTNYLTFSVRFDETLSLDNTVYLQPRFDDFSDYRVLEEVALTLKHRSGLLFSMGVSLRFDSDPPTVLERLDVTLFTKLGVHLVRPTEQAATDSRE